MPKKSLCAMCRSKAFGWTALKSPTKSFRPLSKQLGMSQWPNAQSIPSDTRTCPRPCAKQVQWFSKCQPNYVPGANWQHPAGPGSNIEKHGHFPVVHITYEDALAYAKWKGHSLPTEAQWEWAARAGAKEMPHQHEQPTKANTWQGIFPMANSAEDGFAGLAPVGCYGANAWGLFDMIGNVWELTADVFVAERTSIVKGQGMDPDSAQKPPVFGTGTPQARVIKGGSFLCAPNYCMRYRAGSRQAQEEDLAVSHLGFRTVLQP
jgi:sulfatase modifying factor 1